MKQHLLWRWSIYVRWLGLGVLLLAALAACSNAGNDPSASVPTTTSAQTHLSSIVSHLTGRQQGQAIVFRLPNQTSINNLVSLSSGSASAIWFGEHDTNRIGTLDAQGQLTEYTLPTANAQPGWGVQGLHGDFWVSEEGANRIAEISAQGELTEYALPTANAQPGHLVLWGEMVWWTESAAHKLGRIDQSQHLVEFPVSGTPDQLVTAGSDATSGQLWFTEPDVRKVGHISFDGQVSEFSWPAGVTSMSSVAGDQAGNLWFTTGQRATHQLGYVTPEGQVALFSTGRTHAVAQLLANGAAMEFIEQQGSAIWTISQQGLVQVLLTVPGNLSLLTPLTPDSSDGSYWSASTSAQASQIWQWHISPYGP